MRDRKRCVSAAAVIALQAICAVASAASQEGAGEAAIQAKAAEVKQSIAANQKALRQYTWLETTEISLKGEVKKTERKQCRYATDGQVLKTALPDSAPAPAAPSNGGGKRRGGAALKTKVVENKVADMKEYMGNVAALVKQYVPPDPAKIQASVQGGKAALDRETTPGVATLVLTDYAVPGDKLAIAFNAAEKKLAGVNVNSYLGKEKDTVTLAVRFASLADGVNYPAETVLVAKAKQIQVKISNSGYTK